MRKEVHVRDERRLENDRDVGRVEELDGIGARAAALTLVLDGNLDAERLEIDNDGKNDHGGEQVGDVGKVLTEKCLLDRLHLVLARYEQVEESDESALKLVSATLVDGRRAQGLPDDVLANVGGDEERDGRSKTISLLQKLVLSVLWLVDGKNGFFPPSSWWICTFHNN